MIECALGIYDEFSVIGGDHLLKAVSDPVLILREKLLLAAVVIFHLRQQFINITIPERRREYYSPDLIEVLFQ